MLTGLIVYMTASFFTEAVIHYLSFLILNLRVSKPRILLGSLAVDLIVCPIIYFASSYYHIFPVPAGILSYLLDMFGMFINILSVYLISRQDFWNTAISTSFSFFIYYQTFLITFLFIPEQYALGSSANQAISVLLLLFFTYFIGKIIRRLNPSFLIVRCLKEKKQKRIAAGIGIFIAGSSHYPLLLSGIVQEYNQLMAVIGLFLLFFFSLLFHYITKSILQSETEKAQQQMIAQQNTYIKTLEEIQKDVRLYRHDFKNIMSGMYLDVKNGKTDALESYMKHMLQDFDQNIGSKIQLANQMVHLEIVELKSLLMTKLAYLHSLKIPCHLEVLYPVQACSMRTPDLLRCIGILIDNAAEAVQKDSGDIDIMITAAKDETVFIISNTAHESPNLSMIWKKGYSTKGKNRGLGLYSYQQITNQYQNITCAASWRNQRFYQELRIGGTSYDTNPAV